MARKKQSTLYIVFRQFIWALTLVVMVYGVASAIFLHFLGLVTALPLVLLVLYVQLRTRDYTALQRHLVRWRAVWFAAIAYTAYGLYFWRRHLGLEGIDQSHIVAKQAFTATLVTVLLCLGYYIARLHPVLRVGANTVRGVANLLLAFLPFLLVTWIVSSASLSSSLGLGPLSGGDWLVAIGLTGLFMGIIEIQERTTRHNRHGLVAKHGHDTVKKHLQKKTKKKKRLQE